jgi:nitrogen regulatory protein P-II 1
VRPENIDAIVHALDSAGFHAMTAIAVSAIGELADPSQSKLSTAFMKRYSGVYKLELVCHDDDVDTILHLVTSLGRTGWHGDGVVLVSDLERFVKIRTGEEGNKVIERLGRS